jgi:hypothetical protein
MYDFKTGDLIGKKHPTNNQIIQIGIVIKDSVSSFIVQWTSYNKDFFMEKEGDIFKELNNSYLLGPTKVRRTSRGLNLSPLGPSYRDGRAYNSRKTT